MGRLALMYMGKSHVYREGPSLCFNNKYTVCQGLRLLHSQRSAQARPE